ncbi:hypothetical protein HMPREF1218_0232 [Hoylesella pleuritidis F0068]|uniref:Uncharacterized protein n=1 Tax=Hoylesella pleuritidis F0068 TaxID=1081904 RepID=U2KYR9_9BACT|nr:hypothetical protein HMPREF1218_0232 [Hoylesella pleuritidis F0068]
MFRTRFLSEHKFNSLFPADITIESMPADVSIFPYTNIRAYYRQSKPSVHFNIQ